MIDPKSPITHSTMSSILINRFYSTSRGFQLVCFSLLSLLASSFASAQDNDRVFPAKGGPAIKGKIVERTKDKVVIEVKGTNQSFPTNEIGRIVFDGEPQQLSRAKDLLAQAQVDQAIDEFKKIDKESLKTDILKQEYDFYRGYIAATSALRGKGDTAAAKKILLAWATANSKSNNFYAASEKLGELEFATGNPEQAVKYFGVLAGSPFPDLNIKGNFMVGKALLALKQTAEARKKFDLVAQAQVSDVPSLKLKKLSSIAAVRADAADGKPEMAIQTLEKMVDEGDSTDAELFAEIYNATGNILLSMGNSDEAILAFLKTDLLYASQTEPHAEALHALSQLWLKVGDNQRATDCKSRLAKLYPTSAWSKK